LAIVNHILRACVLQMLWYNINWLNILGKMNPFLHEFIHTCWPYLAELALCLQGSDVCRVHWTAVPEHAQVHHHPSCHPFIDSSNRYERSYISIYIWMWSNTYHLLCLVVHSVCCRDSVFATILRIFCKSYFLRFFVPLRIFINYQFMHGVRTSYFAVHFSQELSDIDILNFT